MLLRRFVLSLVAVAGFALAAAADDKPKRVLLVTHSGGFIHDSVGVAEDILTELGKKNGFTVTTWRYTGDPADPLFAKYSTDFLARTRKPVDKEHMGRINKETLKNFDCVFFFTTGSGPQKKNIGPVNADELKDLTEWVKAGGAFVGAHCATDTLYGTDYGNLVGGYFVSHPWTQKVKVVVEDKKHPAAAGFETGSEIRDEIYQIVDPYSREKVHVIMSLDNSSVDVKKQGVVRKDLDFALAWCHEYGKGKAFYTVLGHFKETWQDERFQKHLLGGMKWAMGQAEGSAAPSTTKPKAKAIID